MSADAKSLVDEPLCGDPYLIFDQADWVEIIRIAPLDDSLGRARFWLAFSRPTKMPSPYNPGEMILGQQVAFYDCDEAGRVEDWGWRYEVEGYNYRYAVQKFRFMRENGLITRLAVNA